MRAHTPLRSPNRCAHPALGPSSALGNPWHQGFEVPGQLRTRRGDKASARLAPLNRARAQRDALCATASAQGSDGGTVYRLKPMDRVQLLNAKVAGYLDNTTKSHLLVSAWSEYCEQNERPRVCLEHRTRNLCEVCLSIPATWDLRTQRDVQDRSIVAAAKLMLGVDNCTSPATGALCDAETLAEVLMYTFELKGYLLTDNDLDDPDDYDNGEAEAEAGVPEPLNLDEGVAEGDMQLEKEFRRLCVREDPRPAPAATLWFHCASAEVGRAVAESFSQIVNECSRRA